MDHSHMDHGHMDHDMPGMDHGHKCNMNVRCLKTRLPFLSYASLQSFPLLTLANTYVLDALHMGHNGPLHRLPQLARQRHGFTHGCAPRDCTAHGGV